MTSEDSISQFSILPGRQSRISNANVIQVRQKVTNFKTFTQVKVKDEKKKLGECKADFQPRTARGCASRGTLQNMKKCVSFFSIQPNYRQSLNIKEGVKKLQTIAEVANYVPYNIINNYRSGKIEN